MSNPNQSLQLKENKKIFNNTVRLAEAAFKKGDLCSTMAWAKVASHFAFVRHPGFYVSANLENLLLAVAKQIAPVQLFDEDLWPSSKQANPGKMRFLHVVTESYPTGGHSALIDSWIKNSSENSVHSIVTTSSNFVQPETLVTSIIESGGWGLALPDISSNMVEQAVFLRHLARNWADVIVLYVHPFDPVPIVAFGIEGGPPIIYSNHADHAFWLGTSIADVVADYHYFGSFLSSKRRGYPPSKLLPIPMLKRGPKKGRNIYLRKMLNIAEDEVLLLTVGRDEKYLPFGNCDFFEVMVKILKEHPKAKLVAVGPKFEGRWKKASMQVNGRIKAVGTIGREYLESYYDAADLYVSSFPCGSETALLEAGLHNLPVIGLHVKELPHISGWDDVAFEKLNIQTSTIDEFMAKLDTMITHSSSSKQNVVLVKESIEREHCSPGWNNYLDTLLQSLPSEHHVRKPDKILAQEDFADQYFAYVHSEVLSKELAEHSLNRLIRTYAEHLPRNQAFNTQAVGLLTALSKVHSAKDVRQYLKSLREFSKFSFKRLNS